MKFHYSRKRQQRLRLLAFYPVLLCESIDGRKKEKKRCKEIERFFLSRISWTRTKAAVGRRRMGIEWKEKAKWMPLNIKNVELLIRREMNFCNQRTGVVEAHDSEEWDREGKALTSKSKSFELNKVSSKSHKFSQPTK